MKKKVLIITTSPLHNGPRLIREIDVLKNEFEITAIGSTFPHDDSIHYINSKSIHYTVFEKGINKILNFFFNKIFTGNFFTIQHKIDYIINKVDPDLVIIHKPEYIPYLFKNKFRFKLVFNAHEYHPLEFDNNINWKNTWGRYYHRIYKEFLPKLSLIINVNEEIAEMCKKNYHFSSLVIPNATKYYSEIKAKHFLPPTIRFIHHGVPNPDRKIELMIKAFQGLGDKFTLDLMLMPNSSAYYAGLLAQASITENVNIVNPVPYEEIVGFISGYDMAIYSLPPSNFNTQFALPNKFFEFVQARLPMVIGPSPVMGSLVNKFNIGIVAEGFEPHFLKKAILSINDINYKYFCDNMDSAAKNLSKEKYDKDLLASVEKLFES